jgi:hypothetical protein
MRFNEMVDFLFELWLAGSKQTILILGPPGIGKTAVGRTVSARITEHIRERDPEVEEACIHVKDLSSSLPEDLNGLPKVDGEQMRFVPDGWLYDICREGRQGVLILDDLPAASGAVQVAARQISLDRRAHEHRISDGIMIMVTGNRREDKSAARTLPAHFRNSVMSLTLEPDLEGWTAWYTGRSKTPDSLIPAFLLYRNYFSQLPKDGDKKGSFATPRTWAMLGDVMPVAMKTGRLLEAASGLVGAGVSAELAGFAEIRAEQVDPKAILENPEKALPKEHPIWSNRPDIRIATLSAISDMTAKNSGGRSGTAKAYQKLVKALAYICEDNVEFVALALSTVKASGGDAKSLSQAAVQLRGKDPRVQKLLKSISQALS